MSIDYSNLFLYTLQEKQSIDEIKKNLKNSHPDWSKERIYMAASNIYKRNSQNEIKSDNSENKKDTVKYKKINGDTYIKTDSGKYEQMYESVKVSEISDIIDIIKDIEYGFINKQTKERITDRDWIHSCDNLSDYYDVQYNPEVTINEKLGICTDQCIAIKYLFEKLHPDYKTQMYALTKGRFGHCVIGFQNSNNEWFYLENAWDKEKGLHGSFKSQYDLEEYLEMLYHKHHDKDNDDDVFVVKYEDYLDLLEFVNYKK